MSDLIKHTAVITVVGRDRVGIIAGVSGLLASALVDINRMTLDIKELASRLETLGQELGISIRIQHSDIFDAMHRI